MCARRAFNVPHVRPGDEVPPFWCNDCVEVVAIEDDPVASSPLIGGDVAAGEVSPLLSGEAFATPRQGTASEVEDQYPSPKEILNAIQECATITSAFAHSQNATND